MTLNPFELFLALGYVIGMFATLVVAVVLLVGVVLVLVHEIQRWVDRRRSS